MSDAITSCPLCFSDTTSIGCEACHLQPCGCQICRACAEHVFQTDKICPECGAEVLSVNASAEPQVLSAEPQFLSEEPGIRMSSMVEADETDLLAPSTPSRSSAQRKASIHSADALSAAIVPSTDLIPALQVQTDDVLAPDRSRCHRQTIVSEYVSSAPEDEVSNIRQYAILLKFPKRAFKEDDVVTLYSWLDTAYESTRIHGVSFRTTRVSSATVDVVASSQSYGHLPPMQETIKKLDLAFKSSKTPDGLRMKRAYGTPKTVRHPLPSVPVHLEAGLDNANIAVASIRRQINKIRYDHDKAKQAQEFELRSEQGSEIRRERMRLDRRLKYLQESLVVDCEADVASYNQAWVTYLEEQQYILNAARENALDIISKEIKIDTEKIRTVTLMQDEKVAAAKKHLERSHLAMRELTKPGQGLLPLWMTKEVDNCGITSRPRIQQHV